eukprot:scaffold401662_cov31-Attheya_sp.AAC.1
MNCGPALAVLLVIQVQGHTIRHHKFLEWGGVRNELPVAPQVDILASKLSSSGSPICTGHVAWAIGDARGCRAAAAAAAIVSTGNATCGHGAGSLSLMLFSKCWNG